MPNFGNRLENLWLAMGIYVSGFAGWLPARRASRDSGVRISQRLELNSAKVGSGLRPGGRMAKTFEVLPYPSA